LTQTTRAIHFKAEIHQILNILTHSLYTEREIFLRELISNASDALTRLDFEMLTNREVYEPHAESGIWIEANKDERTLTVRDTGIGMTADELKENLGTIAHSGARSFLNAARELNAQQSDQKLSDIIGQFGVGFYSIFMVAESVKVISRSYLPNASAAMWTSKGEDTYTVEPAEKQDRGTEVVIKLKEDAVEFADEDRIREIIHRHSDFTNFPIYLGKDNEQVNTRTAIWRKNPREVDAKDYEAFYTQFTLDFQKPTTYTHILTDAPLQVFAILFVPAQPERNMFSARKEEGVKLYVRKVLIQEYSKDLLPEYLGFIQGVVDSEDLPLNVSRESIHSSAIITRLKKLITSKTIEMLKKLATDDPEAYAGFWKSFGRYIKQGVAIEQNDVEALYPLLRFYTTGDQAALSTLDDYVSRMKENQPAIYYILADDNRSALASPHLDAVRAHGFEVILMTDPMVDPFMLMRLKNYKEKPLLNVAQADLKLPEKAAETSEGTEKPESVPTSDWLSLVSRFKQHLGDRVADVRMTDRLAGSPARLVDSQNAPNQETQRVMRMLKENYEMPKKVLELNPRHAILRRLNELPTEDERGGLVIDQLYENALLLEGLHEDPASMIQRIQKLIEVALGWPAPGKS
jgi:molecular chaperone HtpG